MTKSLIVMFLEHDEHFRQIENYSNFSYLFETQKFSVLRTFFKC